MVDLYKWQEDAISKIYGKDAILSAPTGSGKSMVAYEWSKVYYPSDTRIFFTAPIKALSQERYVSLKEFGIDVGIETGDYKENETANVICCTQEIFTLKYKKEKCLLIIDEFHYIYQNPDRTRVYIDALKDLHKDSKVLLISATFSNVSMLKDYLKNLCNRDFEVYETKERAVDIKPIRKGVTAKDIKNSLVFAFSMKGCMDIADLISSERKLIEKKKISKIEKIAKEYEVSYEFFYEFYSKGVGLYYGALLPKEKLFFARIYRERLIDVLVGTDALSLGVNLPAETVVFGQLFKFYTGYISKNEFIQMAGRAGRKGFYDKGFYTYLKNSPAESFEFDNMKENFEVVINSKYKDFEIELTPDYKEILRGKDIKEEASYVANFSYPKRSSKQIENEIKGFLKTVRVYVDDFVRAGDKEAFIKTLSQAYSPEIDVMGNLALANDLTRYDEISYELLLGRINDKRGRFYKLLTLKKYLWSMNSKLRAKVINYDKIDDEIKEIDFSVYDSSSWS